MTFLSSSGRTSPPDLLMHTFKGGLPACWKSPYPGWTISPRNVRRGRMSITTGNSSPVSRLFKFHVLFPSSSIYLRHPPSLSCPSRNFITYNIVLFFLSHCVFLLTYRLLGELTKCVKNNVNDIMKRPDRGVDRNWTETDMIQAKTRQHPVTSDPWIQTYGTIDCGFELMQHAWGRIQHLFSVGATRPNPKASLHRPRGRLPKKWLHLHPVDCLIVECGHLPLSEAPPNVDKIIELVSETPNVSQPQLILEMWDGDVSQGTAQPTTKAIRQRWKSLGYVTLSKYVNSTQVGGAISQSRLVVARVVEPRSHGRQWYPTMGQEHLSRPCSNYLTPPGLVPRRCYRSDLPSPRIKVLDPAIYCTRMV